MCCCRSQRIGIVYSMPAMVRVARYCTFVCRGTFNRRLSRGSYGEEKAHTEFWCKGLKGGDYLEDLHVDGRIILKCTLKK